MTSVAIMPYPWVTRVSDELSELNRTRREQAIQEASRPKVGKLTFKDRLGKIQEKKVTYKQQFLEKSSIVLTLREMFSTMASLFQSFRKGWSRTGKHAKQAASFSKGLNEFNLPFRFLGSAVLITNLVDDSKELYRAHKKKDSEQMRDRGLSLLSGTTSLAETGLAATLNIQKIQGASAAAVAPVQCGVGALSVAAFFLMIASNLIGLFRTKRALKPMEKAFKPGRFTNASSEVKIEGYREALQNLVDKVRLTDEDKAKIEKKTGDVPGGKKYEEEAKLALEKKFYRLKRRVGDELSERIKCHASKLIAGFDSEDTEVRQKSYMEGQKLLESYKGKLYKDLALRVGKIAIGIIGVVASALTFATPAGAAIAGSVLIIGITLATLYAFRVEKCWKNEVFAKGITLFGRTYNTVEIPSASDIIQQEIMLKLKQKPTKYKLPSGHKTLLELCEEYRKMPVKRPPKLTSYQKFSKDTKALGNHMVNGVKDIYRSIAAAAA